MKFSIITATYNSERFLEQTIQSVLSQSYPNIEYIIIDGNSSDNTLSIINKYSDRIAYFISEPDKNMYDAINKGMKVATGDYISILNSDDYYTEKNVIQNVAAQINKLQQQNLAGVYGNLIKVSQDGTIIRKRRVFQVSFMELLLSKQLTMVGHASLFIHKKCLDHIGFYDSERFNYAADYDYILRCFAQYRFQYIDVDIFNFRQHPSSITSSGKIKNEQEAILKKNGYYKYKYFTRLLSYYYIWAKFIAMNTINLLNWYKN